VVEVEVLILLIVVAQDVQVVQVGAVVEVNLVVLALQGKDVQAAMVMVR
jgi:hypothetical protein